MSQETKFLPYTYNTENKTFIDFDYARECTQRYITEKPILTKELEAWGGDKLISIEEVVVDFDYRKGLRATRTAGEANVSN